MNSKHQDVFRSARSAIIKKCFTMVLLLGFLPGCGADKSAKTSSQEEAARPVRVQTINRMDLDETINYVVDLLPFTEVKIFSPVPDRILYFPWKNGDEVRSGQRIALIRKEGLDRGLDQIAAQMEALDIQIQNIKSELDRSKGLLQAGAITQQIYDKVQSQYLTTLAQRRSLEAGKAQMAVTAGNAILTAPIGGVIANKMLEPGDIASPMMPLCKIMNIDRLRAELKLIEADVHKVKIGMEASIQLDCCPNQIFSGKISRIFPYLDSQSRTNTVEVTLENPVNIKSGVRTLKPGMFGTAKILVSKRTNVQVVPESALLLDTELLKQKEGGLLRQSFVVDKEGKAVKRQVRLGARQGSIYEVISGLAEGEQIVVRGQHGLKDGQKVEVVKTP
jgi:membrane fusion protein, multidrug efflux system